MNDMRKLVSLMEAASKLSNPRELAEKILELFIEDGFTVNQIKQESFHECVGIVSSWKNNLDGFYELSDSDQEKVEKWVISRLRKGKKIDPDVADSRGHIGGGAWMHEDAEATESNEQELDEAGFGNDNIAIDNLLREGEERFGGNPCWEWVKEELMGIQDFPIEEGEKIDEAVGQVVYVVARNYDYEANEVLGAYDSMEDAIAAINAMDSRHGSRDYLGMGHFGAGDSYTVHALSVSNQDEDHPETHFDKKSDLGLKG